MRYKNHFSDSSPYHDNSTKGAKEYGGIDYERTI